MVHSALILMDYADTQKFIIEINPAANGVADDAGNLWAGQIGLDANALVVGLTDDTAPTAPTIAPTSPVALDAVFTLTYNENVQLDATYEFLFEYEDGGNWFEFELLEADDISVVDNVVSLDPDRLFWAQTSTGTDQQFRLSIANGSIEDLAENAGPNIAPVVFTTVDNAAPLVTFDPADGDTGESTTVIPTITFSEAVMNLDGSVIDAFDLDTLVVFQMAGVDQPFSATIDGTAKIITVDVGTLEKGEDYTLGIKASFKDDAGNVVPTQEATFTTTPDPEPLPSYISFDPDETDPGDVTVIPVEQAINVIFEGELFRYTNDPATNNIAVDVDYLENVFTIVPAVDFTITIDDSGAPAQTIVTLTPDANLASETGYVVNVKDDMLQIGTGNTTPLGDGDFLGTEIYADNDYITEDVTEPTLDALVPVHNSTVGKSTTIKVDLSEKVKGGTGMIEIFQSNGVLAKEVDASTLSESDAAGIIEITSLSDLTTNLEYYVIIPDGAIVDLAGNEWEGITGEDDWTITVQDDVNPVASSFMPVGENTPIDTDLTIVFDRPVALGTTGFVAVYDADGIAIDLARVVDSPGDFTIDGTEVTIDIVGLAEENDVLCRSCCSYFCFCCR